MAFALSSIDAEYLIVSICGVLLLASFVFLMMAPAVSSFGRVWEKIVAGMLSIYILGALAAVGGGIGVLVVYYWDSITEIL